jgi:Ricin-type beta-trefoil lectin domain
MRPTKPASTVHGPLRRLLISTLPLLTAALPGCSERPISTVTPPNAPSDLSGVYTIQQQSTRRYLDAHDTSDKDFAVVTRPRQDNTTQRWMFRSVGNRIYTIQQQSTTRHLDAHDTQDKDFAVVTRPRQDNTTQRWIVTALGSDTYTIQQQSTRRYLDAHDTSNKDFAVVTRPRQDNTTQRWIIRPVTTGAIAPLLRVVAERERMDHSSVNPLEVLERLAAIMPPPRRPLLAYP